MKLLAFSDLHVDEAATRALVEAGREADLVIGAGDFAHMHKGLGEVMGWLAPLDAKAIYVPGNNETLEALTAATKATVLHGTLTEWDGLRIACIGCAIPELPPMDWGSVDLGEDEAAELLEAFGAADILTSHSPPHLACDRHAKMGPIGSKALRAAIERITPPLVLCRHVHDCWGQKAWIGESRVRNLGPDINWFEV